MGSRTVASTDDTVCPVCLESVADIGSTFLSCCAHGCANQYHDACARKSLSFRAECPVCRRPGVQLVSPHEFLLREMRHQRQVSIEAAHGRARLTEQLNDLIGDLSKKLHTLEAAVSTQSLALHSLACLSHAAFLRHDAQLAETGKDGAGHAPLANHAQNAPEAPGSCGSLADTF